MLEWCVKHAHLSSSGCQLLSQGFQFLLFNKQLLIVSLSQRLQGKNPLKATLRAMQKFQEKKKPRHSLHNLNWTNLNIKNPQYSREDRHSFTSSSLLLSELGDLTCRLAASSTFLLRWAFSCLSLSISASAFETEVLDLKPRRVTRFSLAPLEVMASLLVSPRTLRRKGHFSRANCH